MPKLVVSFADHRRSEKSVSSAGVRPSVRPSDFLSAADAARAAAALPIRLRCPNGPRPDERERARWRHGVVFSWEFWQIQTVAVTVAHGMTWHWISVRHHPCTSKARPKVSIKIGFLDLTMIQFNNLKPHWMSLSITVTPNSAYICTSNIWTFRLYGPFYSNILVFWPSVLWTFGLYGPF